MPTLSILTGVILPRHGLVTRWADVCQARSAKLHTYVTEVVAGFVRVTFAREGSVSVLAHHGGIPIRQAQRETGFNNVTRAR
jgi:hypothetical protein